MRESWLG